MIRSLLSRKYQQESFPNGKKCIATSAFYFFKYGGDSMTESSNKKLNTNKKLSDKSVAARWGHLELFDIGFVAVPIRFLETYSQLQPHITSGEALFIIQLMSFKWDESAPFPGYNLIAKRMGLSDKAVRRFAASLESKKYLKRFTRQGTTNIFDLSPLFDALIREQQKNPKFSNVPEEIL